MLYFVIYLKGYIVKMEIAELINLGIGLLTAFGVSSGFYLKLKNKLTLTRLFLKEVEDAMEDDKITHAEIKRIIRTGKALLNKSDEEE